MLLIALFSAADGQQVKSHKYFLGSDLKDNSVVATGKSIIINYSASELTLQSISGENGTFYKVSMPGHIPASYPGKPELPVLSRLISVPENSSWNIKISEVNTSRIKPQRQRFEGMLFPAQEGQTKEPQTRKPQFRIDKSLYGSRDFIKSDTVRIELIGKARRVNLAALYIYPVTYNPGSNTIEVITSMKIEITFSKSETGIKSLIHESLPFTETVSKGVINYDPGTVIPGYSDKPVRMIILTDTAFRKHLEPYIEWKTQKGFNLDILYKGADFAGNTYTELKDTIKSIYLGATEDNPLPDYLLIVGNVAKIPYYGTGSVTDMYYGEMDGNGDYIPEMFIGRLPVNDTTELKNVVSKIIQYEKFAFADTNIFHRNALATAGYDNSNALYMNGQVNYAIDNYLLGENRINGYYLYNGSSNGDTTKILTNQGLSFINYSGHGSTSAWLSMSFNTDTVAKLKNKNMYPLVISNACQTSSFELSSSFGSKWVTSAEKGAIGFIGASADTYWSEDYYWAVGLGTPSADPTYATTGLGAYDRLFHTHDEAPSEWYTTMGQIIHAGNLAVSASTTNKKKLYWEIYNLVGDPSTTPITGTPDTFNISLPDTLPNNITSWSLEADPFSYVAVSHFDTLWDASHVSPSGTVTITLPGVSNDSCLVVITGQNKIPLIKTIYIGAVNTEYINLTKTVLNDTVENNNGIADYGEMIWLDLTISNLGLADAVNLYAKITSESEWVTISSDSLMIGTLAGGSAITLDKNLAFTVADSIPDNTMITIDLRLKDDAEEKIYKIDISAHAPALDIQSFIMDDSAYGNDDDIADLGETFDLVFNIINEGTSNISGNFNVTTADTIITILESSVKSGVLEYGEITSIRVPVKISESAASGATVNMTVMLECTPYFVIRNISFRVGQIRESFEASSFRIFPWLNISKVPWLVTETDSYDGIVAARSGAIGHNASSTLSIKTYYQEPDSLKFYYKVSSEPSYDFFIFKLNDIEIFKKSGVTEWEKRVVPVPAGYNKMEWIYKKDAGVIGGLDYAMIDMIDFAVSGSIRYVRRDLVTAKLVTPVEKDRYGKETVTIKVVNQGPDTIRGFNLAYNINNRSPVKEYFKNLLVPYGDSVSVSFSTKADFVPYGIYDIKVYGYGNADDYPLNDTLKARYEQDEIAEPYLVFPNPFTDELKIVVNSDVAGTVYFSVFTSGGKKVLESDQPVDRGMNEFAMNGRKLVPGVYYLRIDFPGVYRTVPIVKARE
ncbi:MAG: C25 family cysteine peptidase [Bacteroidota bacterium]